MTRRLLTAIPRRGCSSPARPDSPGRSRRSSSGATRGSSWSTVTSRSDAGNRLDGLYPRYRVPLELTELDIERLEERRRRDRRLPARRVGAGRRRDARLGLQVVDLSADFRLRDLARTSSGTARTAKPELLEDAAYGLHRAEPGQHARRRAGRKPGLLPDGGDARAGAAGRARA